MVSVRAGKQRAGPRRGAHAPHPIPHRQQERTGVWSGRWGPCGPGRGATPFPLVLSAWMLQESLRGDPSGSGAPRRTVVFLLCWPQGRPSEDGELGCGRGQDKPHQSALGSPRKPRRGLPRPRERSWSGRGCSQRLRPRFQPSASSAAGRAPPHPPRKGAPREPRVPGARQTRGQSHVQGERRAL